MPQHESVMFTTARSKRLLLAAVLASAGKPLPTKVLALRTKLPAGNVRTLLRHPWFAKTGPAYHAPWTLTEEGRRAAA